MNSAVILLLLLAPGVAACAQEGPAPADAARLDTRGEEEKYRKLMETADDVVSDARPAFLPPDRTESTAETRAKHMYVIDTAFRLLLQGLRPEQVRERLAVEVDDMPEVWLDPEFQKNRQKYHEFIRKGSTEALIVGGVEACPLPDDRFDDSVRVEQVGTLGPGSGVIICDGVLLTAEHVVPDSTAIHTTFIRAGCDVSTAEPFSVLDIEHYRPSGAAVAPDVALVFFDPAKAKLGAHRTWAAKPQVDAATLVHAVGYGSTSVQAGSLDGFRRVAQGMTVTSIDCCCANGGCPGGCRKCTEVVSSSGINRGDGQEIDICKGDSGGPMVVLVNGRYLLAGITRANRTDTPPEKRCGAGGAFVRLDNPELRTWILAQLSDHRIPCKPFPE